MAVRDLAAGQPGELDNQKGSGGRTLANSDYRIKATAAGGQLRGIGAVTTSAARAAQLAHRASPLAAAAMGRLMTAATLLSTDFKAGERVTCEVRGGGVLGRVTAEAYTDGLLRARVDVPDANLPLRADGKLAVGQAVGTDGEFTVRRHLANGGLFTSTSPLATGEIGDDLAVYLTVSEQVPSAVAVGVLVGTDSVVAAAGGLLVQALPGADSSLLEQVATRFESLRRLSHRLASGERIEEMLEAVMGADVVWHDTVSLKFGCLCSRARSLEILRALPAAERESLIEEGGAEVVCHYCRTAYRFDVNDLTRED